MLEKTVFSMQPMKTQAIQKVNLSWVDDVLGQNFELNCS